MDIWGKSFPGQGTACAKNVSWEHAWCVINEGEESLGSWGQKQVERSLREDEFIKVSLYYIKTLVFLLRVRCKANG